MPHTIRLRGPWQYQVLARTVLLRDGTTQQEPGQLPPPGRMVMPADWGAALDPDFRGRVRFTRVFHCPTGLHQGHRVELVIDQVDAWGQVALNDQPLGPIGPGGQPTRFDVTDKLRPRNRLIVDVELPRQTAGSGPLVRPLGREGKPGGLVGEIRLAIGSC